MWPSPQPTSSTEDSGPSPASSPNMSRSKPFCSRRAIGLRVPYLS